MNGEQRAVLNKLFWHAMTGTQARYATGAGEVRRYAPGFSAIAAFARPHAPDLQTLAQHCELDEPLYCGDWTGDAPDNWRIEAEAHMCLMVWQAATPERAPADDTLHAVPLNAAHVPQMMALTALTKPGPFGPRTVELGDYLGVFDNEGQLIAMSGERLQAGTLHEVSGVCTHPEHQGKGYARRLMMALICRQLARGETPFLHVLSHNTGAKRLYEKMGFATFRELTVRVISRHA